MRFRDSDSFEIARKVPPPPPDPEAEVDPEAPAPEPTVETATVTLDAKGFWGGSTTLDASGAVVAPPPPAPDLPDAEESVGESLAQTSLEDPGETGEPPAEAADGEPAEAEEPEPEPAKHLSELLDDHGTDAKLALARVLAKQNKVVEATDEYASLLGTATGDEAAILKAELAPLLAVLGKPLSLDSHAQPLQP